jgi:TorA maturation chaperone TorD
MQQLLNLKDILANHTTSFMELIESNEAFQLHRLLSEITTYTLKQSELVLKILLSKSDEAFQLLQQPERKSKQSLIIVK